MSLRDDLIEAGAQLSIEPGPRKIQNWRRMWPDQLANLIAVLRGDTE